MKPKGSGQSENSKYMQLKTLWKITQSTNEYNDVLYLQIDIARRNNDNAV